MRKIRKLLTLIMTLSLSISFLQSNEKTISDEDKKSMEIIILGKTVKSKFDNKESLFTKDINGKLVINRNGYVDFNNCFTNNIEAKYGSTSKELEDMLKQYGNLLVVNSIYTSYGIVNVGTIVNDKVNNILNQNPKLKINKKCTDNGVTDLMYSSANTSDILAIPSYMYPFLVKTNSYSSLAKTHQVIDVISFDEINQSSKVLAKKLNKSKDIYNNAIKKYTSESKSNSKNSIGSVIISLNKYGNKKQTLCTLDYNGLDGQRIIGYRKYNNDLLFDSTKSVYKEKGYSLKEGRNLFDKTFKDINTAYLNIKQNTAQCNIFIDYPYNVVKLKQALENDGLKPIYGKIISSSDTLEKYAISYGYESAQELNFANEINATLEQIKFLRKYNANEAKKYYEYRDEMVKSKYSDKKDDVLTVEWFMYDKENGLKKNLTAIQERDRRVAAEKKAKAKKDAQAKKQREEFAKNYPYEAILSCGYNGSHINIAACFVRDGKYGAETELEITNGTAYNMYKSYQLRQAGKETNRGLIIPLKKAFSIKAQNSSKNLLLNLKVRDKKTGKLLFEKSASKYRMISLRN